MLSVDWTSGLAALGHGYFQRRYGILFYSLLLTMVSVPLFGALRLEAGLVELFLAAKLLAAIVPMGGRNERRLLLVILLSVALIMRLGRRLAVVGDWNNEMVESWSDAFKTQSSAYSKNPFFEGLHLSPTEN